MESGPGDLAVRRRRLAYRASHRGTKEMDWLLGRYAEAVLETSTAAELDVIEMLIALPDPELHGWILDPSAITDRRVAEAIARIRRFHGLVGELARPE